MIAQTISVHFRVGIYPGVCGYDGYDEISNFVAAKWVREKQKHRHPQDRRHTAESYRYPLPIRELVHAHKMSVPPIRIAKPQSPKVRANLAFLHATERLLDPRVVRSVSEELDALQWLQRMKRQTEQSGR